MTLRNYVKIKEDKATLLNLEKEAIKKILIDCVYDSLINYINNLNETIDEEFLDKYIDMYLEKEIPVQYISGFTYFYGLKLNVNKNCLIPRSETEILVSAALKEIKENNYQKILEIGTGSGAISIALKHIMTHLCISATDICINALAIAQNNAIINNADITFIESDIYSNIKDQFDVIISNPPYISIDEKISKIVYNNEPYKALFAQDDGLFYYQKIIRESKNFLNKNGMFIFEIGYKQFEKINDLTLEIYPEALIRCFKDYNNLDRIVIIKL